MDSERPEVHDDRKVHVHVESHEGTMLYSDELGRDHCRMASGIAIAIVIDPKTKTPQICWWLCGTPGTLAEMVARYLVSTPGMFEAVQGLYVRELKARSQGS